MMTIQKTYGLQALFLAFYSIQAPVWAVDKQDIAALPVSIDVSSVPAEVSPDESFNVTVRAHQALPAQLFPLSLTKINLTSNLLSISGGSCYSFPGSPTSPKIPALRYCTLIVKVDSSAPEGALSGKVQVSYLGRVNDQGVSVEASLNTTIKASGALVAVGGYNDANDQRPLLAYSQDSGTNWIFPESITAPVFTNAFVSGVFHGGGCSGSTCIAAGEYDDSNTTRPMLAVSNNSGKSWTYPDAVTDPIFTPNNTYPFAVGFFNNAACSGTNCIAVGYYSDGATFRPLLGKSNNSGASWTYPESITSPVFTPGNPNPFVSQGQLFAAFCQGTTCIAAGRYTGGGRTRPMLAVSNDSGANWTFPASVTAPVFSPANTHPFNDNGRFLDVNCNVSDCIASGDYNDGATVRPLVAISHDMGASWSFPTSATEPNMVSHPFVDVGGLPSAGCNGSFCYASGTYFDGTTYRPMVAISNDAGATWTFPDAVTTPVFTPNTHPFSSFGYLNRIICKDSHCFIAGHYNDGMVTRPLIGVSHNSGASWTFPASITAPIFTPGNTYPFSDRGRFNAIASDGSNWIATGYYEDNLGTTRALLAISTDFGDTWTYPEFITAPVFTPNDTFPFVEDGEFNGAAGSLSFLPDYLKHSR